MLFWNCITYAVYWHLSVSKTHTYVIKLDVWEQLQHYPLCYVEPFLPQLTQYYSVAIKKLFLLLCIALWCVFKGITMKFFSCSSHLHLLKKLVRTEAPSFWSANTACLITCKWSPTHLSSDTFMIYSHAPLCPPALSKPLKDKFSSYFEDTVLCCSCDTQGNLTEGED